MVFCPLYWQQLTFFIWFYFFMLMNSFFICNNKRTTKKERRKRKSFSFDNIRIFMIGRRLNLGSFRIRKRTRKTTEWQARRQDTCAREVYRFIRERTAKIFIVAKTVPRRRENRKDDKQILLRKILSISGSFKTKLQSHKGITCG